MGYSGVHQHHATGAGHPDGHGAVDPDSHAYPVACHQKHRH